jgi:cyclohexyl-isocyanide hydratase
VQLGLEYAAAPPFDSGTPDRAPADVLARVRSTVEKAVAERRAALERSATRFVRSET